MQSLVKAGAALLQAYYRHVPLAAGKRLLWHHLVQPALRRHPMVLEARTRFGARMAVRFPDTIQSYVYFFGVWEPAITAYIAALLRLGDTVIDIGANVGYDTLLASHCVGPGGVVHAIEASPSLFAALCANLALNGLGDGGGNVIAHHAAVCAEPGAVSVYLHHVSNLGGTTIVPEVARRRGAVMEASVRGLPLAALVPEAVIQTARLIKIDVEGAEWPVVRGFADLLPNLSPRTELLIEVSAEALRDHGTTVEAFIALFRAAGFAPFVIGNRYNVDMYLDPVPARIEPLEGTAFDQLDILFRKSY